MNAHIDAILDDGRGGGGHRPCDFATRRVESTWPVPGGAARTWGNVSADGRTLWVSGRFDDVVLIAGLFSATSGSMPSRPASRPHGGSAGVSVFCTIMTGGSRRPEEGPES